jgi:O-antigen ligase
VIPKSGKNLGFMALGIVLALSMAGPQVWERFTSLKDNSLTGAETTETSAESRIYLWKICLRMLSEDPLLGKGPDHFPLLVQEYPTGWSVQARFPQGKEAHSLWFQIGAELGIPGLSFLVGYYVLTIMGLWPYVRRDRTDSQGMTEGATARMVWVALVGFFVSAQFVSLEGLELPYYITVVGLGLLKQTAPCQNLLHEDTDRASEIHRRGMRSGVGVQDVS